ncbi:hypothetical protein I3F58_03075 [Streptomyces sp. MUM 203J]|uniref:hypothetical protein n=1 Tax=Streptomyces sp. MUM 203J TaxID=2791990 RepID=UPI001F043073|nr:hypothetical protein [Streptomyces sp. MUM 203J]MCH0538557.1 hypothetical protein [Streptomyces sp. MUM 203J]
MSSDQQYPYEPYPAPGTYADPAADPDVAQTWEGQTWDTRHQPVVGATEPYAFPQQAAAPAAGPSGYDAPIGGTPGPESLGAYVPPVTDQQPPAPPAASAEPAYGAPTTRGSARMTDAQRARAEGRSPIIPPGIQPAGLTALLGVLLAVGAGIGPYALLVPVVLLQAVTAAGWFRLNGMWPARQGIALAFLGGVVADGALLAAGRENAPAAILGTLGAWVLLVLVLQLRSHAAAEERMYGLMATVVSSALAIVAAGFLAAEQNAALVGALAVGAAVVARALPLPGAASPVVALLAAAGAGIAAGAATGGGGGLVSAVFGLVAGACGVIGLRVASYDYPSRFVHMTAGVALPLALAAPVVYLLGRALG